MKEIIKALSKDVIVGLRTIDDSYDNIYYGKIIKYKDNLLDFLAYDDKGEENTIIQVGTSDIVSFDTNSANTDYLTKVINNKDKFTTKKEGTITGSKVSEHLHYLWVNEIPALYHTIAKDEFYAYLLDIMRILLFYAHLIHIIILIMVLYVSRWTQLRKSVFTNQN